MDFGVSEGRSESFFSGGLHAEFDEIGAELPALPGELMGGLSDSGLLVIEELPGEIVGERKGLNGICGMRDGVFPQRFVLGIDGEVVFWGCGGGLQIVTVEESVGVGLMSGL